MADNPEKLMIRIGKHFEASASGRSAILALFALIGVILTGLALNWW